MWLDMASVESDTLLFLLCYLAWRRKGKLGRLGKPIFCLIVRLFVCLRSGRQEVDLCTSSNAYIVAFNAQIVFASRLQKSYITMPPCIMIGMWSCHIRSNNALNFRFV